MSPKASPVANSEDGGTGRCLCGGVTYRVSGPLRPVFNCHCYRCRQTSGHHVAASGCAPEHLHMDSEETLTWYEPANGVFYGFCNRCGSSLFFKTTEEAASNISIMAGTIDQPTGLSTVSDWWTSESADYHSLDASTIHHRFDG